MKFETEDSSGLPDPVVSVQLVALPPLVGSIRRKSAKGDVSRSQPHDEFGPGSTEGTMVLAACGGQVNQKLSCRYPAK